MKFISLDSYYKGSPLNTIIHVDKIAYIHINQEETEIVFDGNTKYRTKLSIPELMSKINA